MSIGIGDTVADVATGAKIGSLIDTAKEDVKRIIEQYQVRRCRLLKEHLAYAFAHVCLAAQTCVRPN